MRRPLASRRTARRILAVGILLAAPVATFAQTVPLEVPFGSYTGAATASEALPEYVLALYEFLVAAVGIIAAVMIMFNGLRWSQAAGNAQKVSQAKDGIVNAIVGLVIALLSWVILNVISPQLVTFQEIEPTEINFYDVTDAEDVTNCQEAIGKTGVEECTGLQDLDSDFTQANSGATNLKLLPAAASAWDSLAQDFYNKYGKKIPINHSFRTPEYQQCLVDTATGDHPAAQCSSPHVNGYGVDVSTASLTQAEYNYMVCGSESTCSFTPTSSKTFGTLNKVSGNHSFRVLNYNPEKDKGRITEQHHFDYTGGGNVCTACPGNEACGC